MVTAVRQESLQGNPRVCVALLLYLGGTSLAMLSFAVSTTSSRIITTAAPLASTPVASADAQKCAALMGVNLEDAPGGPGMVTSARLVEVPATGLEEWGVRPSGYGSSAALRTSRIRQYCDVTGYVAPQNKFELKLPLYADWNQKFFFHACGGFCGRVNRDALNLTLARGYASATGNGGHDSTGIRRHLGRERSRITGRFWLAQQSRGHTHCQSNHGVLVRQAYQDPIWRAIQKADKPS